MRVGNYIVNNLRGARMNSELNRKGDYIFAVVLVVFTILLIPLILISFYNHPTADDYTFAAETYHVIKQNTGIMTIIEVLKAAKNTVIDIWYGWGGYYTSSFLSAVRPSIWNENFTFLHTVILIGFFVIGEIKFMLDFFVRRKGLSFPYIMSISLIMIIFSIQFVPSITETFYWFNGGVSYSLMFALSLMLIGSLISIIVKKSSSWPKTISLGIFALFIAGGHYPVTLPTLNILIGISILVVLNKEIDKKIKQIIVLITGLFLAGFLITIVAPGNYVRLDVFENLFERKSLFSASIYSLIEVSKLSFHFLNLNTLLLGFIVMVLSYFAIKGRNIKFYNPIFMILLSLAIMFSSYIPGCYATGTEAEYLGGRYESVLYFYFILLFVLTIISMTGWFIMKNREVHKFSCFLSVAVIVLIIILGNRNIILKPWALEAVQSMYSGEAQQFDKELDKRLEDYLNPDMPIVYVESLSVKPKILYFSDVDTGWTYAIENYYNKKIILREKKN